VKPVAVWSDQITTSTLGTLRVWITEGGVRRIDFRSQPDQVRPGEALSSDPAPPHLGAALAQLGEYVAGTRRTFDLPLDLSPVTPFQLRVYEELLKIPHGRVVTYGAVASDIGEDASKARAVGQAVGANPIAIVVPCHRVVAADGRLVGFGWGIDRKAALLRLEGIHVDGARPSSRVHPEIIRLPI
jgi:methylated-DNA-[protein]-cysteine S-methyltransferase